MPLPLFIPAIASWLGAGATAVGTGAVAVGSAIGTGAVAAGSGAVAVGSAIGTGAVAAGTGFVAGEVAIINGMTGMLVGGGTAVVGGYVGAATALASGSIAGAGSALASGAVGYGTACATGAAGILGGATAATTLGAIPAATATAAITSGAVATGAAISALGAKTVAGAKMAGAKMVAAKTVTAKTVAANTVVGANTLAVATTVGANATTPVPIESLLTMASLNYCAISLAFGTACMNWCYYWSNSRYYKNSDNNEEINILNQRVNSIVRQLIMNREQNASLINNLTSFISRENLNMERTLNRLLIAAELDAEQQDEDIEEENDNCSICLESFNEINNIVTQCGHRFHLTCYNTYITTVPNATCPMCRANI